MWRTASWGRFPWSARSSHTWSCNGTDAAAGSLVPQPGEEHHFCFPVCILFPGAHLPGLPRHGPPPEFISGLRGVGSLEGHANWTGPLPEGLGRLTRLQEAHTWGAGGAAPFRRPAAPSVPVPAGLGRLSALRTLALRRLHVRSLPDTLCDLQALQRLDTIASRELAGAARGLGRLTALQHLDISQCCGVWDLQEGIGCLPALNTLAVGFCGVAAFPGSFARFTALECLHVVDNARADSFARLTALECLQVADNARADPPMTEAPSSPGGPHISQGADDLWLRL